MLSSARGFHSVKSNTQINKQSHPVTSLSICNKYKFFQPNQVKPQWQFKNHESLAAHFQKHKVEFKDLSNNPIYQSADDYLKGAEEVIKNGIRVLCRYKNEERIVYVRFMGNSKKTGDAKFEFVGTNQDGIITTYHTKSGNLFWKALTGDPKNHTITPYPFPYKLGLVIPNDENRNSKCLKRK